jgi:ribosomal protein L16 Arg81 hydroxylase
MKLRVRDNVDIEVFLNPDDLIPILAKAVSPFFIHPVNPEDIVHLEFERDEEGDVVGVSIQLVRQIPLEEKQFTRHKAHPLADPPDEPHDA